MTKIMGEISEHALLALREQPGTAVETARGLHQAETASGFQIRGATAAGIG
jgi:hypothetical protein